MTFVLFCAVVAVDLLFGHVAFYRTLGFFVAVHGVLAMRSREVPVGIRGMEPSFYLRGTAAATVGVLMICVGGFTAWFAPEVACFFSHGDSCM
jgi:type IV secretory pathway VirB2 component (pilin)